MANTTMRAQHVMFFGISTQYLAPAESSVIARPPDLCKCDKESTQDLAFVGEKAFSNSEIQQEIQKIKETMMREEIAHQLKIQHLENQLFQK